MSPYERDAISLLQRHSHSMRWALPKYEDLSQSGEAHQPTFEVSVSVGPVVVKAEGPSKKVAKQNAARRAMENIRMSGLLPEQKAPRIKSHAQNLHELAQRQGWHLHFPFKERGRNEFVCAAVLNGKIVAEESGLNLRQARENAAQRAAQTMCAEPTKQHFALQIVKLAMRQFKVVTEHLKIANSSCIACFLQESQDGLMVVGIASGTGHYAECLNPRDDHHELVLDGHAEVLARRCLVRHLYREIEKAQTKRPSIFAQQAATGRFNLRPDVYFHLYVSALPCGDAKMFNNNNTTFVRPLQGIHCHNGYGEPLPTFQSINSHWPSMGRKCEGLLRARLNTGESYSPLPSSDCSRPPQ